TLMRLTWSSAGWTTARASAVTPYEPIRWPLARYGLCPNVLDTVAVGAQHHALRQFSHESGCAHTDEHPGDVAALRRGVLVVEVQSFRPPLATDRAAQRSLVLREPGTLGTSLLLLGLHQPTPELWILLVLPTHVLPAELLGPFRVGVDHGGSYCHKELCYLG